MVPSQRESTFKLWPASYLNYSFYLFYLLFGWDTHALSVSIAKFISNLLCKSLRLIVLQVSISPVICECHPALIDHHLSMNNCRLSEAWKLESGSSLGIPQFVTLSALYLPRNFCNMDSIYCGS